MSLSCQKRAFRANLLVFSAKIHKIYYKRNAHPKGENKMKKTMILNLKQWIEKLFDTFANTLESCEWYPCPRQTKLPPFNYKRGDH